MAGFVEVLEIDRVVVCLVNIALKVFFRIDLEFYCQDNPFYQYDRINAMPHPGNCEFKVHHTSMTGQRPTQKLAVLRAKHPSEIVKWEMKCP